MKRREFLHSSLAMAAGAAGATVLPPLRHAAAKSDAARIQRYQTLGRTGLKISDISYGAGKIPSASMALRAIDRGINYFDTAPDYGPSEDHIGAALARRGKRDDLYIASKYCFPVPYQAGSSHLQAGAKKADFIAAVEGSLKRLKTDYLDLVFVHAMGELPDYDNQHQRLVDPEMLAATEALKQAGKVRFLAVSSHGPHHMERLLLEAVNSGHYDVIMPAFNFMNFPRLGEVLAAAGEHNVGVVAMKTLAGAKHANLESGGAPFEHAAFRWVLQHPQVAGLVITIKNTQDLDHYVAASGQPFSAADQRTLDRYAARFGQEYCRTGCGDCAGSCPAGLEIATILRYQMYFEDYGEQKDAMAAYARLKRDASACAGCSGAPCAQACPHGLPLAAKLAAAHRNLSFPV